jgi:CheY-like chemotaxis protein
MTTEQNQPQAFVPDGQAPPPQGQYGSSQNPSSQNQGQGRRRRRRRKGKAAAPQANGQGAQPGQQAHHNNNNGNGHQGQKQKAQPRFYQKNGNGQQQGNGGGGRRKNKQRRQQVFVGPMDHSYRTANGNVADSSPSTIEFRNGNLGNGNGYGGEPLAMWEPPPAPIREDAPTHIYFFIEDLFFLAKIQETAKKLGIKVGFLKNEKEAIAKFTDAPEQERPSLIVFDLNNANAKPLTLIPKLRSKLKKTTSIIGFLSHLQGDLKVKAVEAGCDMVMPRSAFSQNLPSLMRRHGLKDEEEHFEAAPAY